MCKNLRLEIVCLLRHQVEPLHRGEGKMNFTPRPLPDPGLEMKTAMRSRNEGILSIATSTLPSSVSHSPQ